MSISISIRTILMAILVVSASSLFAGCDSPAPADRLYSVSNSLLREYDFTANGLVKIHDYGYGSLVQLATTDGLPLQVLARLRAVEDPTTISYRSFSTTFDPAMLPSPSGYADGYYLLALFGPLDLAVRAAVERAGLRVLDSANPYGLLVKGDSQAMTAALSLCTTEGFRFIRAVYPLPAVARLSTLLLRWSTGDLADLSTTNVVHTSDGNAVVHVIFYEGADAMGAFSLLQSYFQAAPSEFSNAWVARKDRLLPALESIQDIAYIEPFSKGGLSTNIAVKQEVMNIEPVWPLPGQPDTGYDGSGITILQARIGVAH